MTQMTKDTTYTEQDYLRDIHAHIADVQRYMKEFADLLVTRSSDHDTSKLEEPEKSIFHQNTMEYKRQKFGTPEYAAHLQKVKIALDHHYAMNSHHPEHYKNGVAGMDLLDIVEMFCDWMVACSDHGDDDIVQSILNNKERFGFSDELSEILINTTVRFGKHVVRS